MLANQYGGLDIDRSATGLTGVEAFLAARQRSDRQESVGGKTLQLQYALALFTTRKKSNKQTEKKLLL